MPQRGREERRATATVAPANAITRIVPILGWLPRYQKVWLKPDILAGLTAAAVVTPQAMAYATIAGLPVQVGLYVALVPMLVYALLGGSQRLSVSSTSALSILTGTALVAAVGPSKSPQDYLPAAFTLAFLVGVFLVLAAILRLGFLANFISLPVLIGFKAGIGVVIFVSQLGKVLGISVPSGSSVWQTIVTLFGSLGEISWPTVALSVATLALLILLPILLPRVPAPLVAVVVGIAAFTLLNLGAHGVASIGQIPTGLPAFSLPSPGLAGSLWFPAIGIALMSFTESTAAARAFRRHDEPVADANRELFALGMANLLGSLFQAYPAGGGTSQTAVNAKAGAKTQVSELVTVAVVVLILLFLAPVISLMPAATLGCLVLVAAAGLVSLAEFKEMAAFRTREFAWSLLAFVGVIGLGILEGILVAIAISLLTLLVEVDRPPVYALGRRPGTEEFVPLGTKPDLESFRGLLIVRTEGRLFFASVSRMIDNVWPMVQEANPRFVLLDCDAVPDLEYTALQSLAQFDEQLRANGTSLVLVALNPEVLPIVRSSSWGATLENGRLYPTLQEAVETLRPSVGEG